MANPPHFSTVPLAEHIDHDIGHDTACHGDQNQIVTRPVPCIPVTMWQMTTHPRRYRTFRDPVRQRFSPHHVFPHTRRQRRITGITVLHRPVAASPRETPCSGRRLSCRRFLSVFFQSFSACRYSLCRFFSGPACAGTHTSDQTDRPQIRHFAQADNPRYIPFSLLFFQTDSIVLKPAPLRQRKTVFFVTDFHRTVSPVKADTCHRMPVRPFAAEMCLCRNTDRFATIQTDCSGQPACCRKSGKYPCRPAIRQDEGIICRQWIALIS